MTITQDEIKRISEKLAKLALKDGEKLLSDINSILEYVNLLNELDVSNVSPTVSVISKQKNILKEDTQKREIDAKELLECSNQKILANQIAVNDIMK